MRIIGSESEEAILAELGERIKQHRISLGFTQAKMAEKCGLSSSTVTRVESGADSMASNYIKILAGLNMLSNIDVLVPEVQPDFKALYERKTPRQRVKSSVSKPKTDWIWEEDR